MYLMFCLTKKQTINIDLSAKNNLLICIGYINARGMYSNTIEPEGKIELY